MPEKVHSSPDSSGSVWRPRFPRSDRGTPLSIRTMEEEPSFRRRGPRGGPHRNCGGATETPRKPAPGTPDSRTPPRSSTTTPRPFPAGRRSRLGECPPGRPRRASVLPDPPSTPWPLGESGTTRTPRPRSARSAPNRRWSRSRSTPAPGRGRATRRRNRTTAGRDSGGEDRSAGRRARTRPTPRLVAAAGVPRRRRSTPAAPSLGLRRRPEEAPARGWQRQEPPMSAVHAKGYTF